jgi:hypothetical protein
LLSGPVARPDKDEDEMISPMPKVKLVEKWKALPPERVEVIRKWIDQGADWPAP